MDYRTHHHCKTLLAIYRILVVKYRKKLLRGFIARQVKTTIHHLASNNDFAVEAMEVDKDPLHLMIQMGPAYSVSHIVRLITQQTTLDVWRQFAWLKRHFWKEHTFWSDGYFACSVGNASEETIRAVDKQKTIILTNTQVIDFTFSTKAA